MNKTKQIALGLAVLLVFLLVGATLAGSSDSYAIDWQVLDGGGAPATAGQVSLNGSLGQTVIGPSTSASYGLQAGHWLENTGVANYLPVIIKSS